MCTCATAKRRRRQCRDDARYAPRKSGHADKAARRARLAAKAAREGRSFGYSKK